MFWEKDGDGFGETLYRKSEYTKKAVPKNRTAFSEFQKDA